MTAYATAATYAAQYPDAEIVSNIDFLLEQASDAIDMAFQTRGLPYPSETDDELLLRAAARVTCQLIRRELDSIDSELPMDATQASWTAGSYSQSFTLSGAGANLKLNKSDLAALGLTGGIVGFSAGAS